MGSQQTSSTTAATIITYARYHLNEATASTWADAELLVWVNQGTMDIVSRTRCLEGTEDINLATNTLEYTITSDYIDATALIYTDADGDKIALVQKTPKLVGRRGDDNIPRYWYEWNGKVGVFPVLSARTTEIVTLYYVSRPAAVISSANVIVPAVYDKALTFYVAAQGWFKVGQFAKSGRFMAEYLAELDRYRVDFNETQEEPEDR